MVPAADASDVLRGAATVVVVLLGLGALTMASWDLTKESSTSLEDKASKSVGAGLTAERPVCGFVWPGAIKRCRPGPTMPSAGQARAVDH